MKSEDNREKTEGVKAQKFLRENYNTLYYWLLDDEMPAGIDDMVAKAMQAYSNHILSETLQDLVYNFIDNIYSHSSEEYRTNLKENFDIYLLEQQGKDMFSDTKAVDLVESWKKGGRNYEKLLDDEKNPNHTFD